MNLVIEAVVSTLALLGGLFDQPLRCDAEPTQYTNAYAIWMAERSGYADYSSYLLGHPKPVPPEKGVPEYALWYALKMGFDSFTDYWNKYFGIFPHPPDGTANWWQWKAEQEGYGTGSQYAAATSPLGEPFKGSPDHLLWEVRRLGYRTYTSYHVNQVCSWALPQKPDDGGCGIRFTGRNCLQ